MLGRLIKIGGSIVMDGFKAIPDYISNYFKIKKQLNGSKSFPILGFFPALFDKGEESGHLIKHYFLQDLFVSQLIHQNNPDRHVDIGSRVDGFVTHVASYRKIEIIDIRPLTRPIQNVVFRQADLMNLPADMLSYTDSISSLHAIEHFGLGRYGDPIDVDGHLKALNNIHHILRPGGKFYFSVPIGPQGIIYNAHRVFSLKYLVDFFSGNYEIDTLSVIDDQEVLWKNVSITADILANNFNCSYGCGIFELTKR